MSSGIENAAHRLSVLSKSINGVFYKLSALAAGLMVIPTVLDVLSRFLFDKSLIGAMELVEFCMVVLVFSCLGYIQDDRSHIRVTLLTDHFSPSIREMLETVSTLCPFLLL